MLDDSDNGASGYTDWDCIFHLHFKMQMSRCVVVCKPIPPKGNSSMVPQMRPNFYDDFKGYAHILAYKGSYIFKNVLFNYQLKA